MSAVLDRPAADAPELDLRGLDFAVRRRRLFAALRDLRPTEQLRLTSAHAEDLYWLRYEMEARIGRRYCWSPAGEEGTGPARTIVRVCPSRDAGVTPRSGER